MQSLFSPPAADVGGVWIRMAGWALSGPRVRVSSHSPQSQNLSWSLILRGEAFPSALPDKYFLVPSPLLEEQ